MPWYTATDNTRLWYEDRGNGKPLVLVHGWCMSSAVWRFQLEALSRSFRVIAPDLRGHGASIPCAEAGARLEGFSADMEALFRHLDLEGAVLAGWSLGAQVALMASFPLKSRLAGLALIAGTPCFTAAEGFPAGLGKIESDGMALKVRRNTRRAIEGFNTRLFAPGELEEPGLAERVHAVLGGIPIPETPVALQSLQSLAGADLRLLLHRVELPTLIISGDNDMICLPEASAYMASHIRASRHVVFAGCGHAPFLTRGRAFDACLGGFAAEVA